MNILKKLCNYFFNQENSVQKKTSNNNFSRNKILDSTNNKTVLLLANAFKLGGRCLAGVELAKDLNGEYHIPQNKEIIWIRPVTDSESGQIDEKLALKFHTLDILLLKDCIHKPNEYQSENYLISGIQKIDSLKITNTILERLCNNKSELLFETSGNAVKIAMINSVNYSLMFIEAQGFEGYIKTNSYRKQLRGKFSQNNITYDLPITDPFYVLGIENNKNVFLTLSLSVPTRGNYYKLIAGVFVV